MLERFTFSESESKLIVSYLQVKKPAKDKISDLKFAPLIHQNKQIEYLNQATSTTRRQHPLDMPGVKKTKASSTARTSTQRAKAPATSTASKKSAGNSKQRHNVKAPTKKAMKNQKRPASDSDGDTSSDEEPEKRRPHKKTKARHDVEEEEVEELDDNEPEEVEEEDDEEEPEQKTVSYSAALNRVKLT